MSLRCIFFCRPGGQNRIQAADLIQGRNDSVPGIGKVASIINDFLRTTLKSRLSLMRTLASLSLDSRSRRALDFLEKLVFAVHAVTSLG